MSQEPVQFFKKVGAVVGETVQEAMTDHVKRYHLPPPNRNPVTAVPFANEKLSDADVCQALELMFPLDGEEGMNAHAAANYIGVPPILLDRHLAEYWWRYQKWLAERAAGIS